MKSPLFLAFSMTFSATSKSSSKEFGVMITNCTGRPLELPGSGGIWNTVALILGF